MNLRVLSLAFVGVLLIRESAHADDARPATRRFGGVIDARIAKEGSSSRNWFLNDGGNFGNEHLNDLAKVEADNAGKLGLSWATKILSFTIDAEPIMVDRVAYVSAVFNLVDAQNTAMGGVLWKLDPKVRVDLSHGTPTWGPVTAAWSQSTPLGARRPGRRVYARPAGGRRGGDRG